MLFFIIWQGKGGVVFVAAALVVIVAAVIQTVFNIASDSTVLFVVELLLTCAIAVPIWFYGKKWNAEKKEYIDKATGQDVVVYSRNTFFLIPMEYWAFIL